MHSILVALIAGSASLVSYGSNVILNFSFLGVTFDGANNQKDWKFQVLKKAEIPGHPELALVIGTPNILSGVYIYITQKNGKNVGIIYTFPFTESQKIEAGLVQSYGPPLDSRATTWQTTYGQIVQGEELMWQTSAGDMLFDNRSEDMHLGRLVINPTEALEGNAVLRGVPTTNFH